MDAQITREQIIALFATHPNVEAFVFTSDGLAFNEEHVADAHAQRLANKQTAVITREDIAEYLEDNEEVHSFAHGLGVEPATVPNVDFVGSDVLIVASYEEFLENEGNNGAIQPIRPVDKFIGAVKSRLAAKALLSLLSTDDTKEPGATEGDEELENEGDEELESEGGEELENEGGEELESEGDEELESEGGEELESEGDEELESEGGEELESEPETSEEPATPAAPAPVAPKGRKKTVKTEDQQ